MRTAALVGQEVRCPSLGVREEAELEIQCGRVCPRATLLEAVRLDDVTKIVWAELGEGPGTKPEPSVVYSSW